MQSSRKKTKASVTAAGTGSVPVAEAYPESDAPAARQTESPLKLVVQAAGGPTQWAGKAVRLSRTVRTSFNRPEIRRRLERLREVGFTEQIPTPLQLLFGGLDMVRYFIEPGARDYYESRGIHFAFHQLLRLLDDPCALIDPVGVLSERDSIIGHVLQVVHANPLYDLQLLEMFPDGVAEMERQTAAMIDGTHPRAKTIGAVVEDPEYHARLLAYIKRYRKDPLTPQLRRKALNARASRDFVLAEETFGDMPGFFRYANRLPTGIAALLRHYVEHRVINPRYCDAEAIAVVDKRFGARGVEHRVS